MASLRKGRKRRLSTMAVWFRRIASVLVAVTSTVMVASPEETSFWKVPVDAVKQWAWLIVLLATVIGSWLSTWYLNRYGKPEISAILHKVLRELRDGVFGDAAGRHSDHRVTLFAHRSSWWRGVRWCKRPRRGWLVPIARPGHTSLNSSTCFHAPDDSSKAEGVAGQAWIANDGAEAVLDLPDVHKSGTSDDLKEYARRSWVSRSWVEKNRPRTRSLAAYVIETEDSERWGVLVLDSREPHLDMEVLNAAFRSHGNVLGRVVEEL